MSNRWQNWAKTFSAIFISSTLVGLFQNCAKSNSQKSQEHASVDSDVGPMCGIEGFSYLHKNYFLVHCSSCHAKSGFAFPAFADVDVSSSFQWATSISAKSLWDSSTNNRFCGEECSLKPSDPLYGHLQNWLKSENSCD